MAALLSSETVEPALAATAGALSSTLANRSNDSILRRLADWGAGTFCACYVGPMLAEFLGFNLQTRERPFLGVVFTVGIVGAILANKIWDNAKDGNLWDWLKVIINKGAKPG